MEAASAIDWQKAPSQALILQASLHRWFPDGVMNTCHNAVDRHVAAGRGDQKAVIYDRPITGNAASTSFSELQQATARFAGMLAQFGVTAGDRVIIYMPMIPEAVAMLDARARRRAFRRFAALPRPNLRNASMMRNRRPSSASRSRAEPIVAYKPLLDEATSCRTTSRTIVSSTSARRWQPIWWRA